MKDKDKIIEVLQRRTQNLIASDLISPLFWEDFATELESLEQSGFDKLQDMINEPLTDKERKGISDDLEALQGEQEVNLQSLINEISEWSDKTFGEGQRNPAILHHLVKEVPELIDAITKYKDVDAYINSTKSNKLREAVFYEFADCFMLLLDSAAHMAIDIQTIIKYTRLKLEINKKRNWGKPDVNGVIEHTKEPTVKDDTIQKGYQEGEEISIRLLYKALPCINNGIQDKQLAEDIREFLMSLSERNISSWYCPECKIFIDPKDVTFEETHDPREGGCGHYVKSTRKPNNKSQAKEQGAEEMLLKRCGIHQILIKGTVYEIIKVSDFLKYAEQHRNFKRREEFILFDKWRFSNGQDAESSEKLVDEYLSKP